MRTVRAESAVLLRRAYGPIGVALGGTLLAAVAAAPVLSGGRDVPPWWPASALAFLALGWAPRGRRLSVAAVIGAAFLAAFVSARGLGVVPVGVALASAAEVWVAAWVFARTGPSPVPALRRSADVGRLVLAVTAGVFVGAVLTAAAVLLSGSGSPLGAARIVAASHGAALLVLSPFGLLQSREPRAGSRAEAVGQYLAVLLLTTVVFWPGQTRPMSYLVIPLLVWGAVRQSARAAAAQLVVVAALVSVLTFFGGGPFAGGRGAWETVTITYLQSFLAACAIVVLPLTAGAVQRREATGQLEASERLFRSGFRDALLGMVLLRTADPGRDAGGLDVVELNDTAAAMLGSPAGELRGASWSDSVERGDRSMIEVQVRAMTSGRVPGWRGEVRWQGAVGVRWVEVSLSPLAARVGSGLFAAQMVDVTARHEVEERLTVQALHDGLTGLPNRTLLRDRLEVSLAGLADGGTAVLFCDLDDFKHVNDSTGHWVGDLVLVEVARRFEGTLRAGDLAARLGGDEFVVLRPWAAAPAEAEVLAGQLLEALREPIVVEGQPFVVGASIGIAWGTAGALADDLLRDADAAMYAAKAAGKRRAVVFSDEHRARSVRVLRLERELRRALDHGELEVFWQPVVRLADARTTAAEALVRWRHPERGLLRPAEFLDVAESAGLMPELGAWVLERACGLGAGWPGSPQEPAPRLHVNVSARQLELPEFLDVVRGVLRRTGLDPARLVLEVTETQLDQVSEAIAADLEALRALGIGLAADDFGTGYSPLTRVVDLPLTMIKIDQRFVAEMLDDRRSRAVVRTLLRLAESLDLAVVSEGVEQAAQAEALAALGCTDGQGYLWAHPMPPEAFHALLEAAVAEAALAREGTAG